MKIQILLYIVAIAVGFTSKSIAQILIERQVIDTNGEPVPYVNVGVLGTTNGTVSDDDGWFRLRIDQSSDTDTLVVSAIGFKRWQVTTAIAVASQEPIMLEKHVYELDEIVVRPRKLKKKKYGQIKASRDVSRATVNKRGFEDAILIMSKAYPISVQKAVLKIGGTKQKSYSFRVRFYEANQETGRPGKELTKKNYIITSSKKKGNIEIDLEDENIWFDEPVYLSFEWLVNKEDEALTYAMVDSIRALSEQNKGVEETSITYSSDDIKSIKQENLTEAQIRSLKIIEFSGKIPLTYYAIQKKPRYTSYSRGIFLEDWKEAEGSIVGYLEVKHE